MVLLRWNRKYAQGIGGKRLFEGNGRDTRWIVSDFVRSMNEANRVKLAWVSGCNQGHAVRCQSCQPLKYFFKTFSSKIPKFQDFQGVLQDYFLKYPKCTPVFWADLAWWIKLGYYINQSMIRDETNFITKNLIFNKEAQSWKSAYQQKPGNLSQSARLPQRNE
jgi:hypothetical protein